MNIKRGRRTSPNSEKKQANHPLEKVGAGLRSMMPWLGQNRLVDRSKN